MGNRSKRRRKRRENAEKHEVSGAPVVTVQVRQEKALLEHCAEQGLSVPHQLRQWERYFCNHDSYLAALKGWVIAQMDRKGHVRIEDDVDRGLMKVGPYIPNANLYNGTRNAPGASPVNSNPWHGWSRNEDDWDDAHGGMTGHGWSMAGNSWNLPHTAHLPKPEGLCGEEHHVI